MPMSSSSSAVAAKRLEASGVLPSSELFQPSAKRTLLLCLLLVDVVFVFYNPVRHHGVVNFGGDQYITNNPHVRAGVTWETVKWAFTTYDQVELGSAVV